MYENLALSNDFKNFAYDDYSFYLEYVHNGLYKPAAHHYLICEKLKNIINGNIKRLMIFMPARHGKSMTITESFPSYFLGLFPNKRVITVSYGADLAHKFGRKNRQKIEKHGREIFNIELANDNASMSDWGIKDHSGGMLSIGLGGSITGHGADLLIMDDLIKNSEEAKSLRIREKVWEEWQSTLSTRLTSRGAVILVMTRWNEDDIAARLLAQEPDKWEVLSLPCEAEENDVLGREPGAPLWPEAGFDADWIKEKKIEVGAHKWQAMYQQRPSALEGGIIKRSWIQYYKQQPPDFDEQLISVDASFKNTQTSDYCVLGVWGKVGAKKYLLDYIRAKMNFPETVQALRNLHASYPRARTKLIEDKANGSAIIDFLKNEISGIIPINPKESKEARLAAVSTEFESGCIYFPDPSLRPDIGECVEELLNFPNAPNDDFVDMTSQALKRWQQPSGIFIGRA